MTCLDMANSANIWLPPKLTIMHVDAHCQGQAVIEIATLITLKILCEPKKT
jgi:hypothetical protein